MKIGVIGLGTVGVGVVEILTKEKERLEKEFNEEIVIKYGCALEKVELPDSIIYTTDYKDVLDDQEVDTIVELIGGTTIAKDIILGALNKGKNVVTANKALIAHDAKELFETANKNNCHLFYEASVGGGIPVVVPAKESLIANNIQKIEGILNGTTNFILTLMEEENLSFEEALDIARNKGFVEANEALDLDGIDAAHKIAILSMNAYHSYIDFDQIQCDGIRKVTKTDMQLCDQLGYKIKLIARSELKDHQIYIDVSPTLIPKSDLVASVNSSYNVVEITNDYVENVIFYGKGAGRYVTASAVCADIIKTINHPAWQYNDYKEVKQVYPITKSKYYIRTNHKLDLKNAKEYQLNEHYIYITEEVERDTLKDIDGNIFKVR